MTVRRHWQVIYYNVLRINLKTQIPPSYEFLLITRLQSIHFTVRQLLKFCHKQYHTRVVK